MQFSYEFSIVDVILLVIGIFIFVLIYTIFIIIKKNRYNDEVDKKFIEENWKKIEELLSYGKEINYKLAVIEADKLLDYILKSMHFPGETTAERLKMATYRFPRLHEVWWAHKVRNLVVHDVQYVLKYNEAKKVLHLFKEAYREMKAL